MWILCKHHTFASFLLEKRPWAQQVILHKPKKRQTKQQIQILLFHPQPKIKRPSAVPTGILKLKSLREDMGSLDYFSRLIAHKATNYIFSNVNILYRLNTHAPKDEIISTSPQPPPQGQGPAMLLAMLIAFKSLGVISFVCLLFLVVDPIYISASAHYIFKGFLWNCSVPVNTSRFGCMHFHLCKVMIHGQSIN